jgi:hypothetical protein
MTFFIDPALFQFTRHEMSGSKIHCNAQWDKQKSRAIAAFLGGIGTFQQSRVT